MGERNTNTVVPETVVPGNELVQKECPKFRPQDTP